MLPKTTEPKPFFKLSFKKPDGRALQLYARHEISKSIVPTNPKSEGPVGHPHYRFHPLRQEWVSYASHRQNRTFLPPKDYSPLQVTRSKEFPTEMPEGEYDMAVFENLFPSMNLDSNDSPELLGVKTAPGKGVCEVVVFTKNSELTLGKLPIDRIEMILEVLADRTTEIGKNPEIKYVLPFENRGVEQGVTLHHPHGQIYAYPFVPPIPAQFLKSMKEHYDTKKTGLLETIIADEVKDGRRVIVKNAEAIAFLPAFARYTYETWVAPLRPVSYLSELTASERHDLAKTLKEVLQKFDSLWDKPFPYLLTLFQAPTDGQAHPYAHLHFQIFPPLRTKDRLKYLAGTELGAGMYVNDSLPEEKAAELKAVRIGATAQGRVNLMGEHTDYNDGFVLPTSIRASTKVTIEPAKDNKVTLVSSGGRTYTYTLGEEKPASAPEDEWANYLMGGTLILAKRDLKLSGFTATVSSTVPEGSGLSSSAALEIAFLKALREVFAFELSDMDLAKIAQQIENEFVGARVGIMDPVACGVASRGEAIFLDTQSLNYECVKLPLADMHVLVIHSGISHRNVGGGYNERRAQCEEACKLLGIKSLREFTIKDLPKLDTLPEILKQRARHVITENGRVHETVKAIKDGNLEKLGDLFAASHKSLSQDYNVSLPEVDTLVKISQETKGVYGARMTGGGFGGSIVVLTHHGKAEEAAKEILAHYKTQTGQEGRVLDIS